MSSLIDGPNNYGVEVSGWNIKGGFFVENATLRWNDEGEKSVELLSSLHESCVVFVRLIHSGAGKTNFPVAYRVLSIAREDSDGRVCVHLSQLHPHIAAEQNVIDASGSSSKTTEGPKVFAN